MDGIYKDVNRDSYLASMFLELTGDTKMIDMSTASSNIFKLVMGSKEDELKEMLNNLDSSKIKLVATSTRNLTVSKNGLFITEKGNVLIPRRDVAMA